MPDVSATFDVSDLAAAESEGRARIDAAPSVDALRSCYHAVILATGASVGRMLEVPGERLPGSHQAADFVAGKL